MREAQTQSSPPSERRCRDILNPNPVIQPPGPWFPLSAGFVDWLGQLPYLHLAPSHTYQRKKTALLLLSAVLETCTDTWSPGRRKGQPPGQLPCVHLTCLSAAPVTV